MSDSPGEHITLDHYYLALRGEVEPAALMREAHRHLLALCRSCRKEWSGSGQDLVSPFTTSVDPPTELEPEVGRWSTSTAEVERAEERLSELLEQARLAREDLNRLLRLSQGDWKRRVERARTRFRSRAFAQLVLRECQQRLDSEPSEAAALAELVPVALHWATKGRDLPWAEELVSRSKALHRAALKNASQDT